MVAGVRWIGHQDVEVGDAVGSNVLVEVPVLIKHMVESELLQLHLHAAVAIIPKKGGAVGTMAAVRRGWLGKERHCEKTKTKKIPKNDWETATQTFFQNAKTQRQTDALLHRRGKHADLHTDRRCVRWHAICRGAARSPRV